MKQTPLSKHSSRGLAVLLAAAVFLSPHSSSAAIRLLRAWQEFQVAADARNGVESDGAFATFGAGIVGTWSSSVSGSVQNAHASAAVSQTGAHNGSDFVFSGNLSASTVVTSPGAYPGAATSVQHVFEFDVTEDGETISIKVSSITLSNGLSAVANFQGYVVVRTNGQFIHGVGPYLQTNVFTLQAGQYRFFALLDGYFSQHLTESISGNFTETISFSNLEIRPGALQSNPVLPRSGGYGFGHVPRRTWVDPPAVSEFSFQMTSNSLFTGIYSFPTGFSNTFEVIAEGQSLGSFTTNQSVNFTSTNLLGHGVSAFRVRGIAPLVDGLSPTAFPIMLDFDTETADFVMIPNPGMEAIRNSPNDLVIYFAGVLEQSTNLVNWVDVAGPPASPFIVSQTNSPPQLFFRARQN